MEEVIASQFAPVIEYGGFWRRLAASLIDMVWQIILIMALGVFFFGANYLNSGSDDWMNWVIELFIPMLAVLVFWFYRQATPGKILLDLVIVDAKTGQRP